MNLKLWSKYFYKRSKINATFFHVQENQSKLEKNVAVLF